MPKGSVATHPSTRLAGKYRVDEETGCWIWTSNIAKHGYGIISHRFKACYAHRVSYEFHVGPIPKGLVLDHLCRVRHCINPAHLEPVTDKVNSYRGEAPTVVMALTNRCKQGHDLTVYGHDRGNGRRQCGECARQRAKARYYSQKASGIDPNGGRTARRRRIAGLDNLVDGTQSIMEAP